MTRTFLAVLILAVSVMSGQGVAQTPAERPVIPPPLSKDVSYGRFIAEIRAHLATGSELVAERNWIDAHQHLSFPREEIYGVIREDLASYKTPPFDDALNDLARAAKARAIKHYPQALLRVERALDRADVNLKERQTNWPRFEVQVATAVLRAALDEYEYAVANGRIARPLSYQTARGFLLQADRMVESVAVELSFNDLEPLADIRNGIAQLKGGFVSVNAPKQPILDPKEAAGLVARVETAAAKLN